MCGIIGIIKTDSKTKINKTAFNKLTHLIKPSGPDDYGIHHDKTFSFGHRRLSIIDLSKAGKQPMFDHTKQILITFNGEIYNYQDIKAELIELGHTFLTETDTEVILEAYKEWGIKCLDKFNGQFAFCLYDYDKEEFYLVRDRFGIKPLFYSFFDGKLMFCSEIKGIINYPRFKKELNMSAVSSYLSYRYVLGDECLFKDVGSVKPGHYAIIRPGQELTEEVKYYEINPTKKKKYISKKYQDKVKQTFEDAVKLRMRADVPVGAYLSGGIDSTVIVGVASKLQHLDTYTVGFKEKGDYDEYQHAELVARHYNLPHTKVSMTSKQYLNTMKEFVKVKDEPIGLFTENAIYHLCKKIKKEGTTVVLSGEASDELFGGYSRIMRCAFDFKRLQVCKWLPKFVRKWYLKKIGLKEKDMNRCFIEHFKHWYTYFPEHEKNQFFNDDMDIANLDDLATDDLLYKWLDKVKHLNYNEQVMYLFWNLHWPVIFSYMDSTSRANAVEVRIPFADHRFVEQMFKVPYRYKVRWNSTWCMVKALFKPISEFSEQLDTVKYMLKDMFKAELPKQIIDREKCAFPVPLDEWFVNRNRDWIYPLLFSPESKIKEIFDQDKLLDWFARRLVDGDKDLGRWIYRLVNLELWMREFL